MKNYQIQTSEVSDNALIPKRTLTVGGKTVDTPAKAVPARKKRGSEELKDPSRGINEFYKNVDASKLTQARRGTSSAIVDDLETGLRKSNDDEINFVFLNWDDAQTIAQIEAEYMVDLLGSMSDVVTVPLQIALVEAIDHSDGLTDSAYQTYKENVVRFLDVIKQRAPQAPVMGVLPPLGWDFTQDLMRVYERHDIRLYCLNFKRRKPTAARQIGMIRPMMQSIARRRIHESVLFYGINMSPGTNDPSIGMRPAADMATVGMGFDIVGGSHISPTMPPEAFEDDGEVTFRLFDKDEYARKDVLLAELPHHFPDDSSFDPEYVVKKAANSDAQRHRLQKLVNAEQMGLATRNLQSEVSSGNGFRHLTSKSGVTPETTKNIKDIRESFDFSAGQTGLSEF
ncbi:hypothetical protein [Haloarcula japonica]|uniref:Uncharacterized protein n=1 Tax=Haloarcula japonica (strain ATCC 49778 / DSM 6131 / JCM 7785 / NBRC 101032 / NCIMB 13157 / TR-1) TaxID=1227453 RepID=M0LLI9_HALJT|nr:hypothetical protein [Haloarcula japonica]EMA34386.1 hypothetical protein C444_02586 [Haloarcula japonica DSM 6131]